MKITTQRENEETEPSMFMNMHFGNNTQYTGTVFRGEKPDKSQEELFIIYDLKNSVMVMLMKSEDRQFSYAYDWKQSIAHQNSGENRLEKEKAESDVNWDEINEWKQYKKIGQKTIVGYSCDGYRSENNQQVIEVWITREADFGMQSLFMANANAKQLKGKLPEDYP